MTTTKAADTSSPTISGLFTDVFRRADKNDDGRIDVPEFAAFFADDRTTKEELDNCFKICDEDKSNNIDHSELIKFFSSGIGGSYTSLFQTLEKIHLQFGQTLRASYDAHTADKNPTELFKERFLLREFIHQLETLQHNAESALRGVSALSPLVRGHTALSPDLTSSQQPAPAVSAQSDAAHALTAQVDKLAALIHRLEKGEPALHVIDEEKLKPTDDIETVSILARRVTCAVATKDALIEAARAYVSDLRVHRDIRTVACRVIDGDTFTCIVYEFWAPGTDSAALAQPPLSLLLAAVRTASTTHTTSTVDVPMSWFHSK